jgi:hypothetical protein
MGGAKNSIIKRAAAVKIKFYTPSNLVKAQSQ